MKMIDYVVMANDRLRDNLARGERLVTPLVEAFVSSGCSALRLVASGSSRNSCDCIRHFIQAVMGVQVQVVSPEAFVSYESDQPANSFNVVISQSGYSTNTLAAMNYLHRMGMPGAGLTGNVNAPIGLCDLMVVDYGVGVESVDFVTMGVESLIEFLAIFSLYAAANMGTVSGSRVMEGMADLADAIEAHAKSLELAQGFVDSERQALSRWAPAMLVGNGPNYGVAREAALKFEETLKLPAMHFEGEEFVHGPEMQLAPGYLVFIVDDACGSRRLAEIARKLSSVTDTTYLLSSRPVSGVRQIVLPKVRNPLLSAIPNLAVFHYVSAEMADALGRWDVHPYLAALGNGLGSKAPGYDESIRALEMRAAAEYVDVAGGASR